MALNLFGRKTFEHVQYEDVSSYLLINRENCSDINEKAERIKRMFVERGFDAWLLDNLRKYRENTPFAQIIQE